MPMLRTTLAIFIIGTICMMLVGCPGCVKKATVPRSLPPGKNPDVTSGLDDMASQFSGGYTFDIPLSGNRVLAVTADSGAVKRENNLQVFRINIVSCEMYDHGFVNLRMTGDKAVIVRLDKKSTLDTTINGHVLATETASGQQVHADVLHWKSNELIIGLQHFIFTGKNSAGENYQVRAPLGTVNTTFTEMHWTGGGTVEMTGSTRKR